MLFKLLNLHFFVNIKMCFLDIWEVKIGAFLVIAGFQAKFRNSARAEFPQQ